MSSNVLLMTNARASHARGDFAGAARGYEKVLKLDPRNYEAAYLLAVANYQAGRLEAAAAGFAAASRLNPRKVEPHKDRGLVLVKLGRHAEALASFEAALKITPNAADLLVNRGMALKNTGKISESVDSYRAALRLKPGFAEAHNNLANSLSLLGEKEEALAEYMKALSLKPGYVEAHVNAAAVLQELGRPAEAQPLLEKAISLSPRHAEAHHALAQILEADGRAEDALAHYARTVELAPDNMPAVLAMARLLTAESRYDEAIALCDRAIALKPEEAAPYYRIGRALEAKRELPAAIMSYAKALELEPEELGPALRRARLMNEVGAHQDALAALDQLIGIHPGSAHAHMHRGEALRSLGRLSEALASYDQAITLAPDEASFYGMRGSLRSEMGDAAEALADFRRALLATAGSEPSSQAMAEDCVRLLSVDKVPAIYASEAELAQTRDTVEAVLDDLLARHAGDETAPAPEELQIAELAMRHLTGFYLAYHQRNDRPTMEKLSRIATRLLAIPPYEPPRRPADRQRIRVGIASQRLRNHNGANWAYNWFARLPQADYEIFTYAFEASRDPMAAKFEQLGTHRALSMSSEGTREIVARMRADALDMLMLPDVGMTPVSRFLSLHRIAPCQFTAWGHPVTTGSPQMDHYLSSDLMEPAEGQAHYSETLVRMPNLALYLDEEDFAEARGAAAASPADFGLPQGRVLYGCLQSLFKYLPRHDEILPRIAREVPAALFVFLEGSPAYMTGVLRERLERAFAAHGLDAARHVTFLPRQKQGDFDRLLRTMDLCIDSVGWSGGNTSLRNIAFGVPLATLDGEFMRGRHTSAMFRMIGMEELIATSEDAYVELLVRLGKEEALRHQVREEFHAKHHQLYRDESFIAAFDVFLKAKAAELN